MLLIERGSEGLLGRFPEPYEEPVDDVYDDIEPYLPQPYRQYGNHQEEQQ